MSQFDLITTEGENMNQALRNLLEEEKEDILAFLEEHEDDVVRIVSFQWKGFLFTWNGDFSIRADDTLFTTWEEALNEVLERVYAAYDNERPIKEMPCAWCGMVTVPVNVGYCSQKCHDENKKANEQ